MKMKRPVKGWTLVELLVAIMVFGILSTVIVSMISKGLKAYSRSRLMQEVRYDTNNAINLIKKDVENSITVMAPAAMNDLPSSIVLPNVYNEMEKIAPLENMTISTNGETKNIIVLSTLKDDLENSTASTSDVRFITYYANKNILNRYVSNYNLGASATIENFGTSSDPLYLLKNWPMETGTHVVELPGQLDKIEFEVYLYPDPEDSTIFLTNLIRIKVRTTIYNEGDQKQPVSYEEETVSRTATL